MSEACCEACRLFANQQSTEGAASAPSTLPKRSTLDATRRSGVVICVAEKGGSPRRLAFEKQEIVIGRVQGNDIVLPKINVSKRAARISVGGSQAVIVDLKSDCGTYVNGRKITGPQILAEGDKIYIGDFTLTVEST